MATTDSIKTQTAAYNLGMLKLEGAKSILSAIGISVYSSVEAGEEIAVTGSLLASALDGIRLLIESAESDLLTRP
jgi:hypothetical protein